METPTSHTFILCVAYCICSHTFLLYFPQSLWYIAILSYHFLPVIFSAFFFTCARPVFSNVNTLNPSSPLGTVILILNLTICLSFFLSLSLSLSNPPPHIHTHTHTPQEQYLNFLLFVLETEQGYSEKRSKAHFFLPGSAILTFLMSWWKTGSVI